MNEIEASRPEKYFCRKPSSRLYLELERSEDAGRGARTQCTGRMALRLIAGAEANVFRLQSSKTNVDAYQVNGFERSIKNEKF